METKSFLTEPNGRKLFLYLAITVEHHTAVSAGDIWADVIMSRILVGDNGLLHIVHGIDGNLIALAQQGGGKVL